MRRRRIGGRPIVHQALADGVKRCVECGEGLAAAGTDLRASASNYTAGHQPQTITDAAGQTTHTTYNASGQVLTVTNAKLETTTYSGDPNGYFCGSRAR